MTEKKTKFIAINKLNDNWNFFYNFIINYINNNNKIPIMNMLGKIILTIQNNKILTTILFIIISWLWSNILLKILFYFLIIDSTIISLLVLQNSEIFTNSRRLCKNVILIGLICFNVIGGLFSLLTMLFIYMEYSKFINRILFKLLKFSLKTVGNICPLIYCFYPQIELLSFENPDMTIITQEADINNIIDLHDINNFDNNHIENSNKNKKLNYLKNNLNKKSKKK